MGRSCGERGSPGPAAEAGLGPDQSDLAPFWIYEQGDARIERRVLLPPMSRDVAKLERLKRALALYRMVFGQPRQEDLLAYLHQQLGEGAADFSDWEISLLPPAS